MRRQFASAQAIKESDITTTQTVDRTTSVGEGAGAPSDWLTPLELLALGVPIFGVAWAWLLLGERPTWTMVASAALILGSVILSQRETRRVQ